ncbi:MAG: exopolysaccharide biosynthesis polyprenyl glycosylphosphotransferase [Luteibaculaceae bacterium]
MHKTLLQYLRVYFRISDGLALNFSFFVGIILRFGPESFWVFKTYNYLVFLLFFNVAWLLSARFVGIYSVKVLNYNKYRILLRIIAFLLLNLLLVSAFNGVIKTYYSRLFIVYTYLAALVLIPFFRYLAKKLLIAYRKKNELGSLVFILGSTEHIEAIEREIQAKNDLQLTEVITFKTEDKISLERLKEIITTNLEKGRVVNELYVSLNQLAADEMQNILAYCESNLMRLRLIPNINFSTGRSIELVEHGQYQVIGFPLTPLDDPANRMVKRIFDLLFSSLFLVLIASWLFPIIAIFIKMSSRGPVFFIQKRSGINNVEFDCFKFRTMRENNESDVKQATQNDPRITKIGHFLRKTSLDETPQFINVLLGDMSVVGPRPHMLKHTEEYSKIVENFMQRQAIKPGITGLAQSKGYRGEIQDNFMLINRIKLDNFYVENWSLAFDIRIILLTITSLFKKHL